MTSAATVHIAGAGVISAIGNSWAENFFSLQHGHTGIGEMLALESIHSGVLPVGEVKLTNEELQYRTGISRKISRSALLGIHAAKEAFLDSGIRNMNFWRVALVCGTVTGGMDRTERFFLPFHQDTGKGRLRDVVHHECGSITELIADALGISHHVATISAGCTSGANAVIHGTRLIRHNLADVVLAGGTDALSRFALNGLNSMSLVDREVCRPFDAGASGLNPGEGAGFVVLVSDRVLEEEDLQPIARVSGFANTHDAFHHTAFSPEGRGIFAAMKKALEVSGINEKEIDYVNLHGAGVANVDLSEAAALNRVFSEQMPRVSSTKAFTGHTQGACGGIETVFSLMAIKRQCVFSNLRFDSPIPDAPIVPQRSFDQTPIRHVMNNSMAFGGNCSSLIFSSSTHT